MNDNDKPSRVPVSKRMRFKVLERDGFTCQYCGSRGAGVRLELDHRVPVASGGKNTLENLVVACFDCNRGKAASHLTGSTFSLTEGQLKLYEALDDAHCFSFRRWLKAIDREMVGESEDQYEGMLMEGVA